MSMALIDKRCRRQTGRLAGGDIAALIEQIHAHCSVNEGGQAIQRSLRFRHYYRTITFVNAPAWVAHQQDHHPDMEVGYKHCVAHYSTHSVGAASLKMTSSVQPESTCSRRRAPEPG